MVKELRIKKIKSRYSLAIEACRDLVIEPNKRLVASP